jgi:hypothetical protein
MTIRFLPAEPQTPAGKLADAEVVFDAADGVLAGLKLVGFSVWERRSGDRNVTFPARSFAVNGERRSFALLRPVVDSTGAGAAAQSDPLGLRRVPRRRRAPPGPDPLRDEGDAMSETLTLAGCWLLIGQLQTALREVAPDHPLLTSGPRREGSVETLGLVAVVTTVEDDPQAECVGHERTREVDALHWLTEADEHVTLGQALHRYGLDQDGRITLRFPTIAEDKAAIDRAIRAARPSGYVNAVVAPNGACLALREPDGAIVGEPEDAEAV